MKSATIAAIYFLFIFFLFATITNSSKNPKNISKTPKRFKDPKILDPYPEFSPPKTQMIPNDAILTKEKTAWARITEFGTIKTDSKSTDSRTAHLKDVKTIVTTAFAFTALSKDGTVFSWGSKKHGGEIPIEIWGQLQNVQAIFSNEAAFLAIVLLPETGETRIYSWGDEKAGAFIPEELRVQLRTPIKQIVSTSLAFAALTEAGKVVVWGNPRVGGEIHPDLEFQKSLESNIEKIYSNHGAFVALNTFGNIFAWGAKANGSILPKELQYKNIKEIFCTNFAFVALTTDNSIFPWGHISYGGTLPVKFVKNVKTVFSNYGAFAAIFDNKNIFVWGHFKYGGHIPKSMQSEFANKVENIIPQPEGFKAILKDSSEIYWGNTLDL